MGEAGNTCKSLYGRRLATFPLSLCSGRVRWGLARMQSRRGADRNAMCLAPRDEDGARFGPARVRDMERASPSGDMFPFWSLNLRRLRLCALRAVAAAPKAIAPGDSPSVCIVSSAFRHSRKPQEAASDASTSSVFSRRHIWRKCSEPF